MRVQRHPGGPRVYVSGFRVHHGLAGCILVLIGAIRRKRRVVQLGGALVLTDLHDFPWSPLDSEIEWRMSPSLA